MVLDALLEFQQFVFRFVGGDQLIDLDQNMSGMDLLNDLSAGCAGLLPQITPRIYITSI